MYEGRADLLPEFGAFVDALAAHGPISLSGLDWSLAPASGGLRRRRAVGAVQPVVVRAAHGDVGARAYLPASPAPSPRADARGWPVLVWLHGGAWVSGGLDDIEADGAARELCARAGGAVVSVDYRLAPAHPYPAALDDVLAVLAWIADGESGLPVDPDRVVVGGASAGGNLAAGAALWARDHGGPALAGQLLVYPALRPPADGGEVGQTDPSGAGPPFGASALLAPGALAEMWRTYLGPGADLAEPSPYAAPGVASDLRGVTPAAVVVAGFDPFRAEGEEYAASLAAAGVAVELAVARRTIHGFLAFVGEIPALDDELEQVGRLLRTLWSDGTSG